MNGGVRGACSSRNAAQIAAVIAAAGSRNIDATKNFLDVLDSGDVFTFQTFADCPEVARGRLAQVLHGTLDAHAETLGRLNDAGAGIFVMVNAGDGVVHTGARTCRTAANVVRVRALFVDLDGAPVAPVLAAPDVPDCIVQSSPGRWHAYWIVCDCPPSEFSRAQLALAAKFGGDVAVKDLPRVMRLPGFVHRKSEPFVSQLYLPQQYPSLLGAGNV